MKYELRTSFPSTCPFSATAPVHGKESASGQCVDRSAGDRSAARLGAKGGIASWIQHKTAGKKRSRVFIPLAVLKNRRLSFIAKCVIIKKPNESETAAASACGDRARCLRVQRPFGKADSTPAAVVSGAPNWPTLYSPSICGTAETKRGAADKTQTADSVGEIIIRVTD